MKTTVDRTKCEGYARCVQATPKVFQLDSKMIAEVVAARKLETTGHEIIKSVHPQPTMSEAIMEAAAAAYGEVIHL